MEIFFCEQCGKRISPADLDSGRCKREPVAAWCPICTAKLAPPPGSAARRQARRERQGTGPAAVLARSPTVQTHARPTERPVTVNDRLAAAPDRAPEGAKKTAFRKPLVIYLIAGAVALGITVGLVLYALLKKDGGARAGDSTFRSEDSGGKSAARPVAVKTAAEPAQPAPSPARPAPRVAKADEIAKLIALPSHIPRLNVRRPSGDEPVIDGKLDDACWRNVPAQTLVFTDGTKAQPAARGTFQLLATEQTFYIAARFEEDELDKTPLPTKAHDTTAWDDDDIEVFMLPGLDAAGDYFQWIANIAGSTWDGLKSGPGISKTDTWEPQNIRFAIYRSPEGKYWNVEAAIPLAEMPGAEEHAFWRFNLCRNRPKHPATSHAEEFTSWSVLNTSTTHTPDRFGVIAIEALGGKLP